MPRDLINDEETLALVPKVHPKFKPVWDHRSPEEQIALARYFLPHRSSKAVLEPTRPRGIKWYCPFASQDEFPSGHRYCINVYTGCAHGCIYCYAAGYQADKADTKKDFERLIDKDMVDLERFDVPAAPVHLSNSTDPLQPLEESFGHTRYALEQILAHRNRFTTVVILTKNPLLAVQLGYADLLNDLVRLPSDHPMHDKFDEQGLPAFIIEVSVAFWQESARSVYDPGAPPIKERIEGIRALREAGIPVAWRIDPLFPRSLDDLGLTEAQTLDDLENLVVLAKDVGANHVIYSPAKIVQPRRRKMNPTMKAMKAVYQALAAPDKPVFRGGSWRLPGHVADAEIIGPFLEICERHGLPVKCCKGNLIGTP